MKNSNTTTFVSNGLTAEPTRRGSSRVMVSTAALLVGAMAGHAWAQPTEVTKLLGPDGAKGDAFGQAIAVSGDTAIVGAYFNDDEEANLLNAGSAYIFQQDFGQPGQWGWVATMTDQFAFTEDQFGRSVSISGDTAIVGSPKDDDGGHDLGSAFIFSRDQNGTDQWGQVANITAPDANPDDQFGYSVGISGDIAIVGAPFVGDNVGAAYIFSRNVGGPDQWGWAVKLTASDAAQADLFGTSVGISGANVLIGAPSHSVSMGAAYIFNENEPGPTNGWGEVAILTASDGGESDWFGIGVSIRGEGAIVGAFGHFGARGAAYIYRFDGSSWPEQDKLLASDGVAGDVFGRAVSIRAP